MRPRIQYNTHLEYIIPLYVQTVKYFICFILFFLEMGQKTTRYTVESTVINPYDSTKSVDLSLTCLFIRQIVQHIFTYYCQRREAGQKKL